jgi:drug/metabolite transporter (DMT)-like permease
VALGIGNHLLFRYRKKNNRLPSKRPWNNHLHIWLGRILFSLALVNVGLGLKAKRAPTSVFVVFAIWLTFLAAVFAWLIWLKEEEQDKSTVEVSPEFLFSEKLEDSPSEKGSFANKN